MPIVTFTIGGKAFDLSPQQVTLLSRQILLLNISLPREFKAKVFFFCGSVYIQDWGGA